MNDGVHEVNQSDQWKRGGICAMCRRQKYCRTQCTANRKYASLRIQEYVRRQMIELLKNNRAGKEENK